MLWRLLGQGAGGAASSVAPLTFNSSVDDVSEEVSPPPGDSSVLVLRLGGSALLGEARRKSFILSCVKENGSEDLCERMGESKSGGSKQRC